MSSRLLAPSALVLAVALAALSGHPSPSSAAALSAPAARSLAPVDPTVSKTITVDGQEVEVVLTVTRSDAAVVPPSTSVALTLRTTDGLDLPAGLSASVIKLERPSPPTRTFRQALIPITTIRFDPTSSGYSADAAPAYRAGAKLKATIRLETPSGVRYVRFSSVRVGG